jgi:ABC-type multidrug transport system fused ATPase/permease subunit
MSSTEAGTRGGRRSGPGSLRRSVRLFRRFMGGPRPYLAGLAMLVLEAATAVVEPYPIAYLIDYLQGAKPDLRALGLPSLLGSVRFETILLLTTAILLIAAVNSAADSLAEVFMARGGRALGYSVRVAMYSHLQRLPLAYHDSKRTGDVLTRVTGDVLVVEDFVVKSVSNIAASLMMLVGTFALILYQSWRVALVALVVVPLLAFVSHHYSRRIKVASRTQRDREGELASTAHEMLGSIRLVQSYGRGRLDLQRFTGQTERSMRASVQAANIQAQFSFVIALVEALSIAAVVWLGVWLVDRDAITIGTLVLFVLLLQNMFKPSRRLVSEWYKIGRVFASVERIDDLLDREVGVRDRPGARPAPALTGRLAFHHVSFTYPAEHDHGSAAPGRPPVLRDIDFEVAPGEVVSLVGFSGAGKSTVAQLVPRLYDPDEGTVAVDGLDVRDVTLASLRAQVSLVLQETVLLSGSVAENIGYGIADATQADVVTAARMANAHGFITDLPAGYATELGERGLTLSGGQRQRIAIARAFIRRAPVLILDEPTTGLDAESAASVVGALHGLMRGRTTIVISHETDLIRCAGRILVMSGGRIVETGTHEGLLRAGGTYADLFARRFVTAAGDGPPRVRGVGEVGNVDGVDGVDETVGPR